MLPTVASEKCTPGSPRDQKMQEEPSASLQAERSDIPESRPHALHSHTGPPREAQTRGGFSSGTISSQNTYPPSISDLIWCIFLGPTAPAQIKCQTGRAGSEKSPASCGALVSMCSREVWVRIQMPGSKRPACRGDLHDLGQVPSTPGPLFHLRSPILSTL